MGSAGMLTETDRAKFLALMARLDATYAKPEDLARSRAYWAALRGYSIAQIESGADAHIADPEAGKYYPTPAHIIAKIPSDATRPSADEAWAVALESFDERVSMLLNDEIMLARGRALTIYNAGDKIGARLAFRKAYERITTAKAAAKVQPRWFPSLGHDAAGREPIITAARSAGLISHNQAQALLPSSMEAGQIGEALTALPNLTTTRADRQPGADPEQNAEFSARLRDILATLKALEESEETAKQQRIAERRERFAKRRQASVDAVDLLKNGQTEEAKKIFEQLQGERA